MDSFMTPNGRSLQLACRGDTNDAALATALLSQDEYQLKGRSFSGWALDIGSHIGTIAIALAVDNPELNVVAIEPVPENCQLIRESIAANGLRGQVFIEEASAGAPGQSTLPCRYAFTDDGENPDKGYIHQTRYVGNVFREHTNPVGTLIQSPVVTLSQLAAKYGHFTFCKIDCEGCEVYAFAAGAQWVDEIVGEFHDNLLPQLTDLLLPTHTVEVLSDAGGIGLFRAVRR